MNAFAKFVFLRYAISRERMACWILLPLISLFLVPVNVFAQTKQESWQRLLSMNQQFENDKNDFMQFGQSSHALRLRNAVLS